MSAPPPFQIPEVSLAEQLLGALSARDDSPALIDPFGAITRADQLASQILSVAAGLRQHGVGRGDVIGILAPNCAEYGVLFLGANALGSTVTTVNPAYTPREIAFQLRDSRTKWLFACEDELDKATDGALRADTLKISTIDGSSSASGPSFQELAATSPLDRAIAVDPARDVAALPYSSGTTGLPKGVMLTHRNLVANVEQVRHVGLMNEQDVALGVLPFFHIYGMVAGLFLALRTGTPLVIQRRFDFEQMLRLIETHRVSVASLVPPIFLALADDARVDHHDVSSLRRATSGAAPLPVDVAERCEKRLGVKILQGYGLTETSPVTHISPLDRPWERIGASGKPVIGTECRVVDPETMRELPAGTDGEICIRGPQVMLGYLGNPDATRSMIHEEGWLRTGDLGHVDADGSLYVVDRLKELIKYRGQQVAPAELEAILIEHDAVDDVAVVPFPDREAGEIPKAFVVANRTIDAEVLMDHVASLVAPHKRIRRVEFIEKIPRSAAGKILRRELREPLSG